MKPSSIAFPIVDDDGSGILLRLWEDTPNGQSTVHWEGSDTTFATLLGNQYDWVDMQLLAQGRTLLIKPGYELEGGNSTTPLSKRLGTQTNGVSGNSAALALYFATLFELPKFHPDFVSSWVMTGSLVQDIDSSGVGVKIKSYTLKKTHLNTKKKLVDSDFTTPNQALICLNIDLETLTSGANTPSVSFAAGLQKRVAVSSDSNVAFFDADNLKTQILSFGVEQGFAKKNPEALQLVDVEASSIVSVASAKSPTFADLLVCAMAGYPEIAAVQRALDYINSIDMGSVEEGYGRALSPFELQMKAHSGEVSRELWNRDCAGLHVLLSGPTGSGKTALLDILNLRAIVAQEGMALYLAPTRALANEYHRSFTQRYAALLKHAMLWEESELRAQLVLSTGEDFEHDSNIRAGFVSLAAVVTEKANVLVTAQQSELLTPTSRLRVVALDEIHMLCEPHRGGVQDILLAKLRHHATFGGRPASAPLRIVGVTTETFVSELAASRAFSSGNPTSGRPGGYKHPIVISTNARPMAVRHIVQLLAPVHELPKEITICEFSSTEQRALASDAIDSIATQCATGSAVLAKRYNESPPLSPSSAAGGNPVFAVELWKLREQGVVGSGKNERPKRAQSAASVIKAQLEAGYKSIIVAFGSTDSLIGIGHQLAKAMPQTKQQDFDNLCSESDISDDLKSILKNFASTGVYIHSADQPRKLRDYIETLFSDVSDNRAKILLTTETLSYGVNLTADCLVLIGANFPRERRFDDVAGVENSILLSANAFHNLLGRAGRYGKSVTTEGLKPKAMFLIDALHVKSTSAQPVNQSEYTAILSRYYSKTPGRPSFGLSALFFPGDSFIGEKGRSEASLAAEDGRATDSLRLQDFSYNTFRTVCDTLRHLQFLRSSVYPQDVDGIIRFLSDWTVYCDLECGRYEESPTVLQKWESKGVEILVRNITANLIKGGYVLKNGGLLSLTPKAEALINTGVRPTAIEPIRKYLNLLKPECELPVECVAFAFCATPEFWNIAARDLSQIMHWNELTEYEGDGATYLSHSKADFLSTLKNLSFSEEQIDACAMLLEALYDATIMEDQSGRLYASSSYRPGTTEKFQPVLNRTAFYTLCSVVIAWVNGVNENELVSKYWVRKKANGDPLPAAPAQEKKPNNIKVSISDKLGWLTSAAYKYFSDTPGFDPKIKAELLELTDRFRYGVTAKGLPFLMPIRQAGRYTPPPSRKAIHEFVASESPTELIQICLKLSEMALRARCFFKREISSKFFQFDRDNTEATRMLKRALENLFDLKGALQSNSIDKRTRACIVNWISQDNFVSPAAASYASDHLPITCAPDGEWVILSFRNGGKLKIRFAGELEDGELDASAIYLDSSSVGARKMSVFGGLLVVRFFVRGFLNPDVIETLIKVRGAFSIRMIVTRLSEENAMAQAGSLDETLLSLREPGW
ncbi:MAG: DEAD/DEAH box helicase [Betaproteobacteria bacterium]|nr:DEAD/DEAH box helicase [Betaproteobacteria bacterium]